MDEKDNRPSGWAVFEAPGDSGLYVGTDDATICRVQLRDTGMDKSIRDMAKQKGRSGAPQTNGDRFRAMDDWGTGGIFLDSPRMRLLSGGAGKVQNVRRSLSAQLGRMSGKRLQKK